jgi:hypothetical protein
MLPDSKHLGQGRARAEQQGGAKRQGYACPHEGQPVDGHRFPRFSSFWPSERNSPAGPTCW